MRLSWGYIRAQGRASHVGLCKHESAAETRYQRVVAGRLGYRIVAASTWRAQLLRNGSAHVGLASQSPRRSADGFRPRGEHVARTKLRCKQYQRSGRPSPPRIRDKAGSKCEKTNVFSHISAMVKREPLRKSVLSKRIYPGTRPGSKESGDAQKAESLRQQGDVAYSFKDIQTALARYSECVALDPSDHVAYASRSACWLRLKRAEDALDDADRCILLCPTYAKGYMRRGGAECHLGRAADARATYEAGLAVAQPGDDRERLVRDHRHLLARRNDTSPRGAARAAMYRTLRVSPSLDVDGLFEMLQEPERITRETVEGQASQLDKLLEYLARTLECDLIVLSASTPLREAYDRATFACGQLLSAAPGPSSHLRNATRVVNALRHALRCGWHMEPRAKSHGVSKFAANALAILACSHDAADNIRRLATRHLLHGMLAWLIDATPEPDLDAEDAVYVEHGRGARPSQARSARVVDDEDDSDDESEEHLLFSAGDEEVRSIRLAFEGTPPNGGGTADAERRRIDQQRQRVVCGCGALCPRLSAPTWLERLFERGAPSWVREECESFVDAELMAIQLCVVVRDERAPPLGLPGLIRCVARRIMRSHLHVDLYVRPEWRWDAAARVADDEEEAARPAHGQEKTFSRIHSAGRADEALEARPGETDAALARRLQRAFDDDAVRRSRTDPQLPARRLGEWLAASLGYLILFVDGDELFAAHACAALERLVVCVNDASDRICRGMWAGVPLLEKLSALACKDTHAVAILEALAQRSSGARAAMLSLAAALAGEGPSESLFDGSSPAEGNQATSENPQGLLEVSGGNDHHAEHAVARSTDEDGAQSVALAEPDDTEQLSDDVATAPTPSWSEYFHELRGTLGIGSGAAGENDEMVLLVNFESAAHELPVAGELIITKIHSNGDTELVAKMTAVPAAWNERFADAVQSDQGLCGDPDVILGSDAWQTSVNAGGCVLIERSAIRKSPKAPDWASAVQLCADAGAKAAVVSNDLQDDGVSRPAFRMGVFGAKPPPIAGFMVNGADGDKLRDLFPGKTIPGGVDYLYRVNVRTIRNAKKADPSSPYTEATCSLLRSAPTWPLRGVPRDIAQAWALMEVVASAIPNSQLRSNLEALAARMEAAEKRVWLARRLQRHHRSRALLGGPEAAIAMMPSPFSLDDPMEDAIDLMDDEAPLAFVECDRDALQLPQLRRMLREEVGLGAADITGDFEVRFTGESAVGSAVLREWMDLVAHRGFISGGGLLLSTKDHGRSFLPNPAACFVNPNWAIDFNLIGRLIGLALWQQVTLDLPLHHYVCAALLHDGDFDALFRSRFNGITDKKGRVEAELDLLSDIDSDLARSLRWIVQTDDASIFESLAIPFTDALDLVEYFEASDADEEDLEERKEDEERSHESSPQIVRSPSSRRHFTRGKGAEETTAVSESPVVVSLDRDRLPPVIDVDAQGSSTSDLRTLAAGSRVELIAGGDDITVNPDTRLDFALKMCEWRLRLGLEGPIRAMVSGLHAAVPSNVMSDAKKMLSANDLVHLLSGLRDIDVADWRRHTRLAGGLRPEANEVVWFWKVIQEWSGGPKIVKDRLHQCLQFATGSRRVPVGGFAHLVGLNGGKHPFTLSSGSHLAPGSLPTAHACICTIDLPAFASYEMAETKLLAAVRLSISFVQPALQVEAGTKRFDEHATRDENDAP